MGSICIASTPKMSLLVVCSAALRWREEIKTGSGGLPGQQKLLSREHNNKPLQLVGNQQQETDPTSQHIVFHLLFLGK